MPITNLKTPSAQCLDRVPHVEEARAAAAPPTDSFQGLNLSPPSLPKEHQMTTFDRQESAGRQSASTGFEPLLRIKAAADATGLNYWLLLRAVNNGDIPTYQFGNKRRRVRLSDIEAAIVRSGSCA